MSNSIIKSKSIYSILIASLSLLGFYNLNLYCEDLNVERLSPGLADYKISDFIKSITLSKDEWRHSSLAIDETENFEGEFFTMATISKFEAKAFEVKLVYNALRRNGGMPAISLGRFKQKSNGQYVNLQPNSPELNVIHIGFDSSTFMPAERASIGLCDLKGEVLHRDGISPNPISAYSECGRKMKARLWEPSVYALEFEGFKMGDEIEIIADKGVVFQQKPGTEDFQNSNGFQPSEKHRVKNPSSLVWNEIYCLAKPISTKGDEVFESFTNVKVIFKDREILNFRLPYGKKFEEMESKYHE